MRKQDSQSGVALITVMIVAATLIGTVYYMNEKVNGTALLVSKIQKKSKSAYAMKGVVSYAKSLLAARVCIKSTELSGIPSYPCKLTDEGNLERLLITRSVFNSLCTFYRNNNKPTDGLQYFCEANSPPLYRTTFSFNILANNITTQHPLSALFDQSSEYALDVGCLTVKYDSSTSSLHSALATATTTVTAYQDKNCKGDIVSQGESTDIYSSRQISEFVLTSNQSISIGDSSDKEANTIAGDKNITFQSPIFINKNLYIPDSGDVKKRKVNFMDKVYLAGNLKNLKQNDVAPQLSTSGDYWLSQYPFYLGLQRGILSSNAEASLTNVMNPSTVPTDDTLMNTCNDYRNRLLAKNFCSGTKPELAVKKTIAHNYTFGLNLLSEFIPKTVANSFNYNSLIDYPTSNPTTAKIQITVKIGGSGSDKYIYLSPESTPGDTSIDLTRLKKVQLIGGATCVNTATNPIRQVCNKTGTYEYKLSVPNQPVTTTVDQIVKDSKGANTAEFNNTILPATNYKTETQSNCSLDQNLVNLSTQAAADLPLAQTADATAKAAVAIAKASVVAFNNSTTLKQTLEDELALKKTTELAKKNNYNNNNPNPNRLDQWNDAIALTIIAQDALNAFNALPPSTATLATLATLNAELVNANTVATAAATALTTATTTAKAAQTAAAGICDWTTVNYNITTTTIQNPKLTFNTTPIKTLAGGDARQAFKEIITVSGVDTQIFEFIQTAGYLLETVAKSAISMQIMPYDFCGGSQVGSLLHIDLANGEIENFPTNSWSKINGTPISLNAKELEYLTVVNTFFEMCGSTSFPPGGFASYDDDWSGYAFSSWNFNPVDKTNQYKPNPLQTGYADLFDLTKPITNKIDITKNNMNDFHTYSILDRCTVSASATIVKGFLTCRYLIIENRTSDLKMLGSFIVDKITIGTLGNSKIIWQNIYHPDARSDLVGKHQLNSIANCVTKPSNPSWASLDATCIPASLMEKAAPFTWSTFSPQCVITAQSPIAVCKSEDRVYNYNIVKISELYGM